MLNRRPGQWILLQKPLSVKPEKGVRVYWHGETGTGPNLPIIVSEKAQRAKGSRKVKHGPTGKGSSPLPASTGKLFKSLSDIKTMTTHRITHHNPSHLDPVLMSRKYNSLHDLKTSVMQQKLKQKLWAHMVVNNPELLIELEQDEILTGYLDEKVKAVLPLLEALTSEQKPDYIIEELCLRELTDDMRPYRFNFILNVLEEEFPEAYKTWQRNGILTHEVINFERYCRVSFEPLTLTWENVYGDHVYAIVTGQIQQYLDEQTAISHLPAGE